MSDEYEYGIWQHPSENHTKNIKPEGELWLANMTKEDAERWVWEWINEDGGRPDAFSVVRRPIGDWEPSV